ncbi:MAG: ATP synthase F1 subunit epsilon [Planctomycetia bacterium]|nr:ATP synthase F1 subunit epsilon [Planctomycetia bacterium]
MKMKCIVVTPERTVVDEVATFVKLPLFDGYYGVAPNHTPVIGRLGAGELLIRNGDESKSYYVAGGFVEVLNNTVSLMTSRAALASSITPEVAEKALEEAKSKAKSTPEEMALREAAIDEARAMVRLAGKA